MSELIFKRGLYILLFLLVVGLFSAFIGFSACSTDIASTGGTGGGDSPTFSWEKLGTGSWSARAQHQVVLKGEEFYLFGGYDGTNNLNDVWKSSDGVSWSIVIANAAWEGRRSHQVVLKGEEFYLFGGVTPTHKNDVWKSSDGETWTQVTGNAAWTARKYQQVVLHNDEFYLFGGYEEDVGNKNDVWKSSDGATWTQVTGNAAWTGRTGHEVVVKAGEFYLIGGTNGFELYNDVWKSSDGASWTNISPDENVTGKWTGRIYHRVAVKGGEIYLTGGYMATSHNEVWSSSDGVSWTEVLSDGEASDSQWSARDQHQLVVKGDKLYVFGGGANPYNNDVWVSK